MKSQLKYKISGKNVRDYSDAKLKDKQNRQKASTICNKTKIKILANSSALNNPANNPQVC